MPNVINNIHGCLFTLLKIGSTNGMKKIIKAVFPALNSKNIMDSETAITNNPKNLDIGGLFVTISHLFLDLRFMARIKEEFINQELNKDLKKELERLDSI